MMEKGIVIRNPETAVVTAESIAKTMQSLKILQEAIPNVLLEGKIRKAPVDKPDWSKFWGEVSKLGLSQDEVHEKLKVKSINDWLSQGRSLDQALAALREAGEAPTPPGQPIPPKEPKTAPTAAQVTPDQVQNIGQLFYVCDNVYHMKMADVLKELNAGSQKELEKRRETPWECWLTIKAVRG